MAADSHQADSPLAQTMSSDTRDNALNGNGTSTTADHPNGHAGPPPSYPGQSRTMFDEVINSDLGISTLLNRLKQSISSARDFAAFLKKRSSLEEEHAQGLRKLCRATYEGVRRPENRQGSYAQHYGDVIRVQERMADHGAQFALALHHMHDEIHELAGGSERGRKHWKQAGLTAEKRSQDAELLMEKAKLKYESLAEDYDRVKTGDRQAGRVFGLRGPRSAAQLEEDLQRKVQAADTDYASKVQTAQSQRQELVMSLRPQAVEALQGLIRECDSALTMQMQKFASLTEAFLLNNGLSVTPINGIADGPGNGTPKTLRDVVLQIDNEKDLQEYVLSFAGKVPAKSNEIKYERHPSLGLQQQGPPAPTTATGSRPPQQGPSQLPPLSFGASQQPPPQQFQHSPTQAEHPSSPLQAQPPASSSMYNPAPHPGTQVMIDTPGGMSGMGSRNGHPPLGGLSSAPGGAQYGVVVPPPQQQHFPSQTATPRPPSEGIPMSTSTGPPYSGDLPPLKPVFGSSLDELYRRDGSAVPIIIYQCIQAVDLFGLEVEGIYRLSGTTSHVARIRSIFDHDAASVDFRNPEHFFHDVNSVAGALKQFLRDLPDPLLTREHYPGFIEAARIEDDIIRRDSLHAVINSLPDPNYATLRALILHLHRVQDHSSVNRMNSGNLAICFGPTLMGSNTSQNISDAGWQVRVVDTILQNTYQIFDDD